MIWEKGGEGMKLLIRQRVFSWSDTYDVYDETGSPKYYVKAEVWTLGHRIHVYEHGTGGGSGADPGAPAYNDA